MLNERAQAVVVGRDQDGAAGPKLRDDGFSPVRENALDRVVQAFGARKKCPRQLGIARVAVRVPRVAFIVGGAGRTIILR
jgi:hypothetical protein